ncbi:hypothetical protein AVEN_178779-1 [Araneus ventricosus]|uniref:Uncharacterized protein n=1 Tax=Araneus ventricosus TaxID=182803 RepID=A0A4Y2N9H9_ARAVE|nr:hypothetical protein AVEN_178779-1 [Araneus ventricosus]
MVIQGRNGDEVYPYNHPLVFKSDVVVQERKRLDSSPQSDTSGLQLRDDGTRRKQSRTLINEVAEIFASWRSKGLNEQK